MDAYVSRKLEQDPQYKQRLVKLCKDYLKVGRDALAYWSSDFDRAYDVLNCYAPLEKKDMELLERGHPKRFILPMTATQITTMTTYVAQVLFGQDTPWKVEGRRAEDELPAEFVNQLLRWNAEQQPTYPLGYLWCQDAIATNRGIFYNSWTPIFKPTVENVEVPDADNPDPETGKPRTFFRPRRKNRVVGGYCRAEIVSPFDFFCDPSLPLWRLQEMRFCGHRTVIATAELQRRAKLPPSHPSYVSPAAVKELVEKVKKGTSQIDPAVPALPGSTPNPSEIRLSRTAYERTRALMPSGDNRADRNDLGDVECFELWVKLVPSANKIYGEDNPSDTPTGALNGTESGSLAGADTDSSTDLDEPVIFQFLVAGGDVILSLNESTYAHGMFPYSVAEGRPNAHFQFSPGYVSILRGIQDYVDWLKNRHQEALSRTIGNIFVYNPSMVDVTDFMNPDKEGLLISLKPEAAGQKIQDVIQQIPIRDMTANFQEEAMEFLNYSETVTAASASMQGAYPNQNDISATQFAGTQQMGAGRLTSIARLLSAQALVPQAKQFVSNFQQFMEDTQEIRFKPSDISVVPPELQSAYSLKLTRDTIAGEYNFIAHDGTLPGTDGRKVAAITKLLEAAQGFPQYFTEAPGNFNVKKLLIAGVKATGVRADNFLYTLSDLSKSGPPGQPPAPGAPPTPSGAPAPPLGATPGPKPAMPALPNLSPPTLPSVTEPQPRPGNL